jgi:hypothetical protein
MPQAPSSKGRDPAGASVDLTRLDSLSADALLREESSLRDPTPLFLPTPFNSTQAVRPESSLREPGDSYRVSAKLVFGAGAIPLSLPDPVQLPSKPADELGRTVGDRPFSGFGQKEMKSVSFPKRDAVIEVMAAGTGSLLLSIPVQGLSLQDNIDWKPCEFFVETDAAGMVGEPPLVSSSGADMIDQAFHDYLVRQWAMIDRKAKLPAGAYRILLGP